MATVFSEVTSSSQYKFIQRDVTSVTPGPGDCDDELKAIFTEINKLAGDRATNVRASSIDGEDIEQLMKKAHELAMDSQVSSLYTTDTGNASCSAMQTPITIPHIKVTHPKEEKKKTEIISPASPPVNCKDDSSNKSPAKENGKNVRRKSNVRPFSASNIDVKRKEAMKTNKTVNSNSPKKTMLMKQELLSEELKNTNERVKMLEFQNVKIVEENKAFRSKLKEICEEKNLVELKLTECENFITRLGKEYENKKSEMNSFKEYEKKLTEELAMERNEKKNLINQHDKDKLTIQDLQRQCKEMELILRRKHPDSVSALIVASKSSTIEDNKRKLLEERVMRLEGELSDRENSFQTVLSSLQEKFSDMKQKYESHIIDVERQLMEDRKVNMELKNKISRVNMLDECVQVDSKLLVQSVSTQTFFKSAERLSSAVSRLSQNSSIIFSKLREDSYLIATIKGLQAELTSKQRTISKINRETEELRKSLRNMQKEKEVLHNFNPTKKSMAKQTKSMDNLLARINNEMESELQELRRQKEQLSIERDGLMQSLKRTNEEFISLKKKRIQDLHTLQLSHEKELMQMNMQLFPLQEEVEILNKTVEVLQSKVQPDERARQKTAAAVRGRGGDVRAGGDNALQIF